MSIPNDIETNIAVDKTRSIIYRGLVIRAVEGFELPETRDLFMDIEIEIDDYLDKGAPMFLRGLHVTRLRCED